LKNDLSAQTEISSHHDRGRGEKCRK
jgi:hypothetical protein